MKTTTFLCIMSSFFSNFFGCFENVTSAATDVVRLKTPKALVVSPINVQENIKTKSKSPSACMIKFTLVIEPGFHTMANPASESRLTATQVIFEGPLAHAFQVKKYPNGKDLFVKGVEKNWKVYEGEVEIPIEFNPKKILKKDDQSKVIGMLKYQACNESKCLLPRELRFEFDLKWDQKNQTHLCETES